MSARDTGETAVSPSGPPADPPSARPSWDVGSRPAGPPRPPARPAPAEAPKPYYAAPPSAPAPPPPAAPVHQAEEVKYDLAGNPIAPRQAAPVPSYAPPAQFGYSGGPATSWPPAVGGPAYGGGPRNNSGEQDHVPPEIERLRWHWGAFFFPVLWMRKHGLTTIAASLAGGLFLLRMLRVAFQFIDPMLFLVFYIVCGVAYLGVQLYFGLNGHKIGWRNRHFPGGLEEYFKVQSAWMWWGFGVNIVLGVVLPVMAFLGLLSLGLAAPHHSRYGSRYGNGSGNTYGGGYSRPSNSWPTSGNGTTGGSGSDPASQGGN